MHLSMWLNCTRCPCIVVLKTTWMPWVYLRQTLNCGQLARRGKCSRENCGQEPKPTFNSFNSSVELAKNLEVINQELFEKSKLLN